MAIYKVPELLPIFEEIEDTHTYMDVAFHPHDKTVVISRFNHDTLYVYSYESDNLKLNQAIPLKNLAGDDIVPDVMIFTPSGDKLITQVIRGPGIFYFQIRNTSDYSIDFELRLAPWQLHAHFVWHPNDKRLYMPWNGRRTYPGMGGIDVYNLTTGIFESFVDNEDYYISSPQFEPRYIAFTPEGKQMVVLSGGQGVIGPVHVIDIATKQIVRRFQPNYNGASRAMALIPIDWEKEK
jgi:WD40 repeat protein